MMIVLSHISALEFWRSGQERVLQSSDRLCSLKEVIGERTTLSVSRIRELRERGFGFLSDPVHLLVPNESARSVTSNAVCHVCPKSIPNRSFVRILDNVCVCLPELTFVQVAHGMELSHAVLTGLELCGAFRMPVGTGTVLFQRAPITSVAALSSYMEKCSGMFGIAAARHALRYIADGSESPMEAKLLILLCFPLRLGGYGLPFPMLNLRLATSGEIRKATGRGSYRCDLLWPEAGLAVEYDGADHGARISDDAIRRTALSELGVDTIISVTAQQMKREAEFELIVKQIKRLLGIRRKASMRDWSKQRNNLRVSLLMRGDV